MPNARRLDILNFTGCFDLRMLRSIVSSVDLSKLISLSLDNILDRREVLYGLLPYVAEVRATLLRLAHLVKSIHGCRGSIRITRECRTFKDTRLSALTYSITDCTSLKFLAIRQAGSRYIGKSSIINLTLQEASIALMARLNVGAQQTSETFTFEQGPSTSAHIRRASQSGSCDGHSILVFSTINPL